MAPLADDACVDMVDVVAELGGIATRCQLLRVVSRAELDRALSDGCITRVARNRYALTSLDAAVSTAHALSGVLCLTSAALRHGWAVKHPPELPHVSVGRRRKLTGAQQRNALIHYHDLHADDIVDGIATNRSLTLQQCLRTLPHDDALAVADSALRAGDQWALRTAVATARGTGAKRVRTIAEQASPDAANPFESVLRSIALRVPGLRVRPQALITSVTPWVRPDLVDEELRIVLEADSFQWHGDRAALREDARRYDRLVANDWLVLRFAWEDVMFDQSWVREILLAAVQAARRRAQVSGHPSMPA